MTSLDQRLDDLQARLVGADQITDALLIDDVRRELAGFGTCCHNTVPGERGEGVEVPATPESIKATIAYLQKEWDDAETRIAELDRDLDEANITLASYVQTPKKENHDSQPVPTIPIQPGAPGTPRADGAGAQGTASDGKERLSAD